MKRRSFIQNSLIVSGSLWVPGFIKKHHAPIASQKKLVVIQLSGGNDGLNTWVPHGNDTYYALRPSLAVSPHEVLKLNDEMGLNPEMEALRSLFDQGYLLVLNQVGYPNAERSHFRAMDIWHTGSNADEYWQTGWLGRYLDSACQGGKKIHHVIELDDSLSLSVKGENAKALAMQNPQKLYRQVQGERVQELLSHTPSSHASLEYMYKTLTQTVESAEYVHDQLKTKRSTITYPATAFGKQLRTIAELIQAGLDTQVYYLSLSGFDTHVRQGPQQARLLKQYSEAVAAFVEDLSDQNQFEDTLILTFSEFGRRVAQNASGGTDHGKANSSWLIGKNLKQTGFFGGSPDLQSLDEGDLGFKTDFRQIYASLLENWLEVEAEAVLKREFAPLPIL
ncbi:MAG: DUF1501 domain-containing protein [Bacteroidota bacterium]